jgi:hypothetical protein
MAQEGRRAVSGMKRDSWNQTGYRYCRISLRGPCIRGQRHASKPSSMVHLPLHSGSDTGPAGRLGAASRASSVVKNQWS